LCGPGIIQPRLPEEGVCYRPPVAGHMYDPSVQRALLDKLVTWRRLPEGDLFSMLSPVERLRYRPEALQDLEYEGLITIVVAGDEPVVAITPAGEAWLQLHDRGRP